MSGSARRRVHYDEFPWVLRLQHEGFLGIQVERRGTGVHFDPVAPIEPDEVCIVTWTFPEQLAGVLSAMEGGGRPAVLAHPAVLAWLAERGSLDGTPLPLDGRGLQVADMRVEAMTYEPIPYAAGPEAVAKVKAALRAPGHAVSRLVRKARLPSAPPVVVQLTLPGGRRLLHLNLSLHDGTPDAWLDEAVSRFGGADWILVGVDYGAQQAFLDRIGRFGPGRVLVTDLVGELRRGLGLPTHLLSPVVDEARERGMDAYVFSTQASFRFE